MNLDSLPTTNDSLQGNIAFGNSPSSLYPSKDVLLTEPIKDTIVNINIIIKHIIL